MGSSQYFGTQVRPAYLFQKLKRNGFIVALGQFRLAITHTFLTAWEFAPGRLIWNRKGQTGSCSW
jgi:hypothetical protein